jgi:hypothetical protein
MEVLELHPTLPELGLLMRVAALATEQAVLMGCWALAEWVAAETKMGRGEQTPGVAEARPLALAALEL